MGTVIDERLRRLGSCQRSLIGLASTEGPIRVVGIGEETTVGHALGFRSLGPGFASGERILVADPPMELLRRAIQKGYLEKAGLRILGVDDRIETIRMPARQSGPVPIRAFAFEDLGQEVGKRGLHVGVAVVDDGVDSASVERRGAECVETEWSRDPGVPRKHGVLVTEVGLACLAYPRGIRVWDYPVFDATPYTTTAKVLTRLARIRTVSAIDAVNASLSGPASAPSPLYVHAASALMEEGKVLCSAGSNAGGPIGDPALSSPLAVGATTNDLSAMATFSARAAKSTNFVVDPGDELLVEGPQCGSVESVSGTSFATPQVTWKVALVVRALKEAGLSPSEAATRAVEVFKASCRLLNAADGSPRRYEQGGEGWGLCREQLLLRTLFGQPAARSSLLHVLACGWDPWWETLPTDLTA